MFGCYFETISFDHAQHNANSVAHGLTKLAEISNFSFFYVSVKSYSSLYSLKKRGFLGCAYMKKRNLLNVLSKNIMLQSFFYIFYFKKGKGTQSTKLEITILKKNRTLT